MAQPIIPWPGGKRRLAKHLLPLFEIPHTCYVEPFAGAAAMLFARPEPARSEVLNDINHDLVNLYRVVQHHLVEFVRQYQWALTSREMFQWAQKAHVDGLTDVQRAARFFYLQQLTFGGKVAGRTFGTSTTGPAALNLCRLEETLSAAHLRLSRVTIEHLPWADCIGRYDRPHTLFFVDPPYWQTQGYGVEFGIEQYEQLAAKLAALEGRAVLTINDHPDMRRVFGAFRRQRVELKYSMNREVKSKAFGELIYRTW
ncbi:MAG: DNA adenine methylase [Rudaea sp.]|uniref:DNA adenine methylase n=1 Tax=unclassified Rudaea TaxID=2627037 RepID=UPI0010F8DE66|nr:MULTISPECIES: DNA adenine methylase [unclassified Rudaea]MBN8885898.1 DNA adenine methylase [Rudaea sp.]MBR0343762.1 DNA adenine methylase [Rudaea sp.]